MVIGRHPAEIQNKKKKSTPQKKWFFWSKPYKIEVLITSLIEIPELPNFSHMVTSTI